MRIYSNIIDKWCIAFKHLNIAYKRKYRLFKGKEYGKIDAHWGIDENIIQTEYYKSIDCGRLVITYHRVSTQKDWERLISNR